MTLYKIITDNNCFGIISHDNRIVLASSNNKWAIGQRVYHVLQHYIRKRKAQVEMIELKEV